MADLSIQFHALPDELVPLVVEAVSGLGVFATAMKFFPFEATEVGADRLPEVIAAEDVRRLGLTRGRPALPAASALAFLDLNPEALILDLGRVTEKGLKESGLSARTSDPETQRLWQGLVKKLRAITSAGAIAVNPNTGATSALKSHRYTAGAKQLADRGVPILPVAGTATLRLG